MTRSGIDPLDGQALRRQLLRTDFAGVTGRHVFDQITQDRIRPVALVNTQWTDAGYSRVEIGELPNAPTGNISTWQRALIQWPGGVDVRPIDGIQEIEIETGVESSNC